MATELTRKIRGTRVGLGNMLKQKWASASATDCEPLTFGDLQRGDRFIVMPSPGDNSGHGGLLGDSVLFIKTDKICHPEFPMNCLWIYNGTPVFILDNQLVIKIL